MKCPYCKNETQIRGEVLVQDSSKARMKNLQLNAKNLPSRGGTHLVYLCDRCDTILSIVFMR
ncbi:MAG: hypothetical protein ACTSW1_12140 [Candidatus Hodarchaeales archaeon]